MEYIRIETIAVVNQTYGDVSIWIVLYSAHVADNSGNGETK